MDRAHYGSNDPVLIAALASGKYLVTPDGRVWNLDYRGTGAPRECAQKINSFGYLVVSVEVDNVKVSALVHRLVLLRYLGAHPEKRIANHKDGVKKNNLVSNLEWVDQSANVEHAWSNGLRGRYVHPRSKQFVSPLTDDDVRGIFRARLEGETYGHIAARYSLTKSAIYRILRGKSHAKIYREFHP